ncbi:MAG: phenazine biosynthesis protein PhzF family [Nevskia sp.]|nr:phenazine biosynthesis protein PhzF family [Nevskia sp.]
MRYRYLLADVFTEHRFGGNPLAVFPHGSGLDSATMQAVARELNLSETVFVLPPDDPAHTCRLRIFTPTVELPFAGHPTVGSAFLLASDGFIKLSGGDTRIVFEEGVGAVPVTISQRAGAPLFAQFTTARLPSFGSEAPSIDALAAVLSLQPDDVLDGRFAPQVASCGVPFLMVGLRGRAALRRARFDLGRSETLLSGFAVAEFFAFTLQPETANVDVSARMFAPAIGVVEDPATGSAAAALAGYLALRDARTSTTLRWRVEQGVDMGRPSLIELEADKQGDAISAIRVGGASVWVGEGQLELPMDLG